MEIEKVKNKYVIIMDSLILVFDNVDNNYIGKFVNNKVFLRDYLGIQYYMLKIRKNILNIKISIPFYSSRNMYNLLYSKKIKYLIVTFLFLSYLLTVWDIEDIIFKFKIRYFNLFILTLFINLLINIIPHEMFHCFAVGIIALDHKQNRNIDCNFALNLSLAGLVISTFSKELIHLWLKEKERLWFFYILGPLYTSFLFVILGLLIQYYNNLILIYLIKIIFIIQFYNLQPLFHSDMNKLFSLENEKIKELLRLHWKKPTASKVIFTSNMLHIIMLMIFMYVIVHVF